VDEIWIDLSMFQKNVPRFLAQIKTIVGQAERNSYLLNESENSAAPLFKQDSMKEIGS